MIRQQAYVVRLGSTGAQVRISQRGKPLAAVANPVPLLPRVPSVLIVEVIMRVLGGVGEELLAAIGRYETEKLEMEIARVWNETYGDMVMPHGVEVGWDDRVEELPLAALLDLDARARQRRCKYLLPPARYELCAMDMDRLMDAREEEPVGAVVRLEMGR